MLIAHDGHGARTLAAEAERGQNYACPVCATPVILKRGSIVVPHFAHTPRSQCWLTRGESLRHLTMKAQVGAWLQSKERGCRYEVIFGTERRADVVSRGMVVECQASALSIAEWEARTRFYNGLGYAVLWLWDEDRLLSSPHDEEEAEYRIPSEIRHCHQMSYGRIYALDVNGEIWQWHLHKVTRGGDEYFIPDGGGDTDVAPEYSPRSIRRPQCKESAGIPHRMTGPNRHLLTALDRGAWWKQ